MVNWLTLMVPFAYLGILIGSLVTFSSLYRKRKLAKAASLAPWFGQNLQRDIYLTLLHMEPEAGQPKVPDSVLKAALLRRATEDVHRIVQIRNAKQALSTLLQKGCVGDDLWKRFSRAEKEVEEELRDVVQEANGFVPGWGQVIFQSASEIAQNIVARKRLEEIQAQVDADKEWWEKKKASVSSEFMKELDNEAAASPPSAMNKPSPTNTKGSDDDAVIVEAGGPSDSAPKNKKKGKK
ncbi:hypothetical protein EJ05DRAFT_469426 [Pseudovirgaria hyperparasitica]|uniref:Translocation protein-like protein sec66 n=1 Tax=Pseudovirgaria hyperparasitica TaxID=470096 RepID=A0A6A6VUT1_9PEZI|nr:uncharacterized protein EJ05DRAFT_469426 [Pseudovirgaria hyperparasitica]KAF2754322.1 hypothetical protein EJ05DRAFT_469426 [Pseudovirgaria hyperparasitica]